MAGGGSSEMADLRRMVKEVIGELKKEIHAIEKRIAELENLLPMDTLPGGGGTSGESIASKKKAVKKPKKRSKKG